MPNRLAACLGHCFSACAGSSPDLEDFEVNREPHRWPAGGAALQAPAPGGAQTRDTQGATAVAGVADASLPADTASFLLATEQHLGSCRVWPKSGAIGQLMRVGRTLQCEAAHPSQPALPDASLLERYRHWRADMQVFEDMWAKLPTLNQEELDRLEVLEKTQIPDLCRTLVSEQLLHARHECEAALKAFGDRRFLAAQAAHERAAQHVRVGRAIVAFAPMVTPADHGNWATLADQGRLSGTFVALDQALEAVALQRGIASFRTRFLSAGQASQLSTGFVDGPMSSLSHREDKPRKQLKALRDGAASLSTLWHLPVATRALAEYLERQLPRGGRSMTPQHRQLMASLQVQSQVTREMNLLVGVAEQSVQTVDRALSALIPGANYRADLARELHESLRKAYDREDFDVIAKGYDRLLAIRQAAQSLSERPAEWTTLERNAQHRQDLIDQARPWTEGDPGRLTLLQRVLVNQFKEAARYMAASLDRDMESRALYEMEELLRRLNEDGAGRGAWQSPPARQPMALA